MLRARLHQPHCHSLWQGASHEPVHAAYTGHGMSISSLSGDAFASLSVFLAAIELAAFANGPAHRDGWSSSTITLAIV
jgi:hypothetical protein